MEREYARRRLSDLNKAIRVLADLNSRRKEQRKTLAKERKEFKEQRQNLKHVTKAMLVLQATAENIQMEVYESIASVVNKCLQSVFQSPYEFKLSFIKRKGKTDALFSFTRNRVSVNPKSLGGVADIASIALRLAVLSITRPAVRKLVIQDEPFLAVDKDNMQKLPAMLRALSKELGFQFLFATHEKELQIGNTILIQKEK